MKLLPKISLCLSRADYIHREIGYSGGPLCFDHVTARFRHIRIEPAPRGVLPEGVEGAMKRFGDSIFIIHTGHHSRVRTRFTIAHELGHAFLHYADDAVFPRQDSGLQGLVERQADVFGAALLMPVWAIDAFLEETQPSSERGAIHDLAAHFDVSIAVARRRFHTFLSMANGPEMGMTTFRSFSS